MEFRWLGLQDYEPLFQKQKQSLLWPTEQEEVWGLEHPLVISLGRRARAEEEVMASSPISNQTQIVLTDRGGLATLHSPGQLLVYPLLSLKHRQWRPRDYVCRLLKTTQKCLREWGLETQIDKDSTGLFVNQKKIGFVGVRITGGRTYHGLSLNISNNLTLFNAIRACGCVDRPLTSLHQEKLTKATPQEVFKVWEQSFFSINN